MSVNNPHLKNLGVGKHWLTTRVMEAFYQGKFNWNEHQGYSFKWFDTYRAYWQIYFYDHPEEVQAFGIFTPTIDINGLPNLDAPDTMSNRYYPWAWKDNSLAVDGEATASLSHYQAINQYDRHGHSGPVEGEKFTIYEPSDLTKTVHKIFDEMETKTLTTSTFLHQANIVLFDTTRCTFIQDKNDLLDKAQEYNQTFFGGYFNDQGPIIALHLSNLDVEHNRFYQKVEDTPPVITIKHDFTDTFQQDGTVTIDVNEKADTYGSGVKDVTVVVKMNDTVVTEETKTVSLSNLLINDYTVTVPISGVGKHEIIVNARDRAHNSATERKRTITISEKPVDCNNWNGSGVTKLGGASSSLVTKFESNVSIVGINSSHTASAILTKNTNSLSEIEFVEVLQAFFLEYENVIETDSLLYFILFYYHSTSGLQWIGTTTESDAKDIVDQIKDSDSSVEEIITYGFCQAGATEGAGEDKFPSVIFENATNDCDTYPDADGVSSDFLKGTENELIENVTHINSSETQLQASFNVKAGASADDTYKLIQDFLHKAKNTDSFSAVDWKYKYFTLVHIEPVGTAFEVRGATSISKLWKESSTFQFTYSESVSYTVFGYCDKRKGILNGSPQEKPKESSSSESEDSSLTKVDLGNKTTRNIVGIVDGHTLGSAVVVTPELVINRNWNWKADKSANNAMCVNRENFYNYLGHYIAPAEALTKAPFENDLTRSSTYQRYIRGGERNGETETIASSNAPFLIQSKFVDGDGRVMKIVASSKARNDKTRATNKTDHPDLAEDSQALATDIDSKAVAGESRFSDRYKDIGVPAVTWGIPELRNAYGVDHEDHIIECKDTDRLYNKDLSQNFSAFTEYVWGKFDRETQTTQVASGATAPTIESDDWGSSGTTMVKVIDPKDGSEKLKKADVIFQTSVQFKITITATNDKGKSDAGFNIGNLNRRATNDTKSWVKIWIGDVDDESTDVSPGDSRFPTLYEFYNPYFSTGKLGFGNGISTTKTFNVTINRKPHEKALRIYTQGYIGGNRRGELSPKSFLPAHGKVFDFASQVTSTDLFGLIPNFGKIDLIGINLNIRDMMSDAIYSIEDGMNSVFNTVYDFVNTGVHLITNGIFGFLFAVMGETYAETYHSKLEIEIEEEKKQTSNLDEEVVEKHPATKYFRDGVEDPLAYIYTQFHYPQVDENRFRVFGKKYHYKIPFMKNEIKTGDPVKGSDTQTKNRYYILNLFRLTYETNIGVFYDFLLRQSNDGVEAKHNYNIKLENHKDSEDSNKQILMQKQNVYDMMFPTNHDSFKELIENGLGTNSCYSSLDVEASGKEQSKIDSSYRTKKIDFTEYSNVYSKYQIADGTIDGITEMIGKFSEIEGILNGEGGYDVQTWTNKCLDQNTYKGLKDDDGNLQKPKNLSYKIMEYILWYLDPNGIAQKTRRDASSLFDFEKQVREDAKAHNPNIPSSNTQPIIINGQIYDSKCYAKSEE